MRRLVACLLVGMATLAGVTPARAQRPEDRAAAEALFAEGSALVNAGRYREGCPKLERAQALVLGVGVTLYVGECREQAGDLVHAWEQFKKAEEIAVANGDARHGIARERADRLWSTLPRITVVVSADASVPGLTVTDDGATIDRGAWGVEHPVEPRVHRIRAVAPDHEPWETAVEASAAGASVKVVVPLLRRKEETTTAPALLSAPKPAPPAATAPLSPQRVASYSLVGLGVVGIAVGTVYGVRAKAKLDDSNASNCNPNTDACNKAGLAERSDALDAAFLSTVAFVGAAACVAGGVVLYLATPKRDASVALAPRAEPGGAGLVLDARW